MSDKTSLADYNRPSVSVDKLDELADFTMNGNGVGKMAIIIAGIKLIICAAYIFARKSIIKQEMEIASQKKLRDDLGQVNDDLNTNM